MAIGAAISAFIKSLPAGFRGARALGSAGLKGARGAKLAKGTGTFKGLQARGIAGKNAIRKSWNGGLVSGMKRKSGESLKAFNKRKAGALALQQTAIKNAGIVTGIGVGGLAVINGRNEANANMAMNPQYQGQGYGYRG